MSEPAEQLPTHAGAVVFRGEPSDPEFLLVTARGNSREWGLPKGHLEPGESPAAAARREIGEETGVVVEVLRPLCTLAFEVKGRLTRVTFFLACLVHGEGRSPEGRQVAWARERQAAAMLAHPEARAALAMAADTCVAF